MLEEGRSASPSVPEWYGGWVPGWLMDTDPPPGCPGEHKKWGHSHVGILSFGAGSALSWARPIKPLAPFKYYMVTLLSNASSVDQKGDTEKLLFYVISMMT